MNTKSEEGGSVERENKFEDLIILSGKSREDEVADDDIADSGR
jgi:hypothetical protein